MCGISCLLTLSDADQDESFECVKESICYEVRVDRKYCS